MLVSFSELMKLLLNFTFLNFSVFIELHKKEN